MSVRTTQLSTGWRSMLRSIFALFKRVAASCVWWAGPGVPVGARAGQRADGVRDRDTPKITGLIRQGKEGGASAVLLTPIMESRRCPTRNWTSLVIHPGRIVVRVTTGHLVHPAGVGTFKVIEPSGDGVAVGNPGLHRDAHACGRGGGDAGGGLSQGDRVGGAAAARGLECKVA